MPKNPGLILIDDTELLQSRRMDHDLSGDRTNVLLQQHRLAAKPVDLSFRSTKYTPFYIVFFRETSNWRHYSNITDKIS